MQQYFDANLELWNEKVPVHKDSDFYRLEDFKKGWNSLNSIELDGLGDVKGKSMLHLQCHFGQDSLSWTRMGAKVTGIDFSDKAVQLAQSLNDELGLDAHFICSNVYDTRKHVEEQFDIVFTSYGTIGWLPDINQWAKVVADSLKPGGTFYIADFHPMLYMFDFPHERWVYDYFHNPEPILETVEGTYTDRDADIGGKEFTWSHSPSETIMALINQGLQLVDFQEFPYSPYNCFSNMKAVSEGKYVFGNLKVDFPHVFSLKCRK